MADGKKYHDLHIDHLRAGRQCQRVRFATHVGRRAITLVEFRETAGGENHRSRLNRDPFTAGETESDGADRPPVARQYFERREIADAPNVCRLAHFAPERRCHGWTGVEKVDVATALDAVSGRHFLLDAA